MQMRNTSSSSRLMIELEKFRLIANASLEFVLSSFPHLGRSGMMQTRAKSSRRQKVTVRWLPVELILEIFRKVQNLIGRYDFKLDSWKSMQLDQEYHNNLLAFALSSKEWTAIAQAELFKNLILGNRRKTRQFLEVVRENKESRSYAGSAMSIRFGGGDFRKDYDEEGLGDDLDKITLYCPNLVEISCYRVHVRLDYFRTSFYLILFGEGC
jgi:hypothetical protein